MLSSDKEGAELAYQVTELVSTHALFPWQLRNKTKAQLTKRQGSCKNHYRNVPKDFFDELLEVNSALKSVFYLCNERSV